MSFEITATPGQTVEASVLLLAIKGADQWTSQDPYRAVKTLHAVLGEVLPAGPWVLPSITGAFVIFPDHIASGKAGGLAPHQHALAIAAKCAERGLAIAGGMTYGGMRCVRDFDGNVNLIGVALNRSSRFVLALFDNGEGNSAKPSEDSPRTQGLVLSDAYVQHHDEHSMELAAWPSIRVYGKRDEVFAACRLTPDADWPSTDPDKVRWEAADTQATRVAILLAFDLQRWSEGKLHELGPRFEALRDNFQNLLGKRELTVAFASPGGDGAVVGLVPVVEGEALGLDSAPEIGEQLLHLVRQQSEHTDAATALDTRIGVHYGKVSLYPVASVMRPAGLDLLRTDKLAESKALNEPGVVLSDKIALAKYEENESALKNDYYELEPLVLGGTTTRRWKKKAQLTFRIRRRFCIRRSSSVGSRSSGSWSRRCLVPMRTPSR